MDQRGEDQRLHKYLVLAVVLGSRSSANDEKFLPPRHTGGNLSADVDVFTSIGRSTTGSVCEPLHLTRWLAPEAAAAGAPPLPCTEGAAATAGG